MTVPPPDPGIQEKHSYPVWRGYVPEGRYVHNVLTDDRCYWCGFQFKHHHARHAAATWRRAVCP